jgi:hypothetical protein
MRTSSKDDDDERSGRLEALDYSLDCHCQP